MPIIISISLPCAHALESVHMFKIKIPFTSLQNKQEHKLTVASL